jgi:hypothetical protein
MRLVVLLLSAACAASACGPRSPELIAVTSRAGGAITPIAEGDLLVLDASPLDGDGDVMDLCVEASRTEGTSVELRKVRGQCRRFVVTPSGVGSSRIRFEVRGTTTEIVVEVVASR